MVESRLVSHQPRLVVVSRQNQKILERRVLTMTIRCVGKMATTSPKKKKKAAKKPAKKAAKKATPKKAVAKKPAPKKPAPKKTATKSAVTVTKTVSAVRPAKSTTKPVIQLIANVTKTATSIPVQSTKRSRG